MVNASCGGFMSKYCTTCGEKTVKEFTGKFCAATGKKIYRDICSVEPCKHSGCVTTFVYGKFLRMSYRICDKCGDKEYL